MPMLGADMEDGVLVEWLKRPGDPVRRGDIIAVVETEKGAIEIEVFEDGELTEIVVPEGTRIPVGAVLALIDGAAPKVAAPQPVPPPPVAAPPAPLPPLPTAGERLRISPVARRRAAALGIDPAGLTGTGPGGAISLSDVEAAPPQTPAPGRRVGFDPAAMRKAIGAAMARSKREIPHYYLASTIDMTRCLDWLAAENARRPVPERLLDAAPVLKAVALALHRTPGLNGHWIDGQFRPAEAIHLGTAVSLRGGGLMAPAIHDADRLGVDALMAKLKDVVTRARTGGLRSSELTDPTVTVTSLGEDGAEIVYPVIYPPQVAMVGFGAVVERPWAVAGEMMLRRVQTVTLAADHRVSDGRRGSRFLKALDELLQEPDKL